MDKRTRAFNALNGLPVDHVPVGFWFHFSGEEAEGQGCVDAHIKYYQDTDLDIMKIMSDGFNYPIPPIQDVKDIAALKPLDKDHPFIRGQVDRAKAITNVMGKDHFIMYTVFAPFSCLRNGAASVGVDDGKIMKFLYQDVNAVMKGLDVIAESLALLSELLITEGGCDGIYYCVQGGEKNRFTPKQYEKFIRPSDLYVLEHANRYSDSNVLHMCGWAGNSNQLELWQDYPAKAVNWAVFVEGLSLNEGRYFVNGKTVLGGYQTLWDGNGHTGIIYDGTKEEVQNYTKELILNYGKLGLMLGGDCTIDDKLEWERIKWVVEAARSI